MDMAEVATMERNSAARARRAGWVIAVAALILDQATKNLLLYGFDFGRLGPLARIVGAAFS